MSNVQFLFWFDVEDFINSESEEALVRLLDVLDERGIKGVFKFVGEKIRMLETHRRTDILSRLDKHEVGYHTNNHSVHPVVTEYLEPLNFRAGALEFERREASGLLDLQRISGQPVVCYGQPGAAWAPQAYPVLKKWGIETYLDVHNQITWDNKPFWYGGLLHFTHLTGIMGMPLQEGALEKAKARFDLLCEMQKNEPIKLISMVYHPTEFVFSKFWDAVNFSHGVNIPRKEWRKPPLRPEGDFERYIHMVGEFVDYTLARGDVTYTGTHELLQKEVSDTSVLSEQEIKYFAARLDRDVSYQVQVHNRRSLSAAELLWAFRQHLLGKSPAIEMIYGPEHEIEGISNGRVKVRNVIQALHIEFPEISGFKQLPDAFHVDGKLVNPVDMICTLAAIIREGLQDDDEVELVKGELTAAKHSAKQADWVKYWPIFDKHMEVPNILAMARRQTWTLKPALFD